MSISSVFDISQKSLAAYQEALDVTANNISNASNPDYSRQQVILTPDKPQQIGNFIFGTGVKLGDIRRVSDTLTNSQIIANNQKYSDSNQRSTILNQVQQLFSEPSNIGLASLSTAFFNSWQQLSVTPNSTSLRNNVIQAAQNLSSKIQNINDGLNSVKSDLVSEANGQVTQLNSDIKQVQNLNSQIFQAQTAGQQPNDLMDQRDKVLNDLSNIANVNISYDSGNSAIISIGGVFVADRSNYTQLQLSNTNGKLNLTTTDGSSTASLNGGTLFALTDMYNNTIPGYQSSFDGYVNNLMNSVNAQHSTGYTINKPPQTGVNFFSGYQGGTLTINSDIVQDPNKIAVSSDGTAGNGNIALNIANLLNQQNANGTSLLDNYTQLISQVGNDTQSSTNSAQSYKLVLNQLQTQKASISGVSTDEEMSNVIQYQKSYDASAKIFQIASQMLDTLINMVA
ncbi:MAG: flagellar hook-associated protein FlgK [Ignavibacteriaceae bacterium]